MQSLKLTDSEQPTAVKTKQEALGMHRGWIQLHLHVTYSMMGGESDGKKVPKTRFNHIFSHKRVKGGVPIFS